MMGERSEPEIAVRALRRTLRSRPATALSAQERRLLELVAEGFTNRQIAERMFLAEKTIKNYVSNLLLKLGMSRRTEAAVYATHVAERQRWRDD